ncbi:hypothetical protein [Aeromonas sobria]|uniref:hypothetical protein n=1 Tax=Aeromonas sobria TaxID=646 RepID=UPI003F37125D
MAFDFIKHLKIGESAANEIVKNNNEIEFVIRELENAISEHIGIIIHLHSTIQLEDVMPDFSKKGIGLSAFFSQKIETGYDIISLHHDETSTDKPIFLMKKSPNGYPVTIIHNKREMVADSKEDLSDALGVVISDPKTIFKLRSFCNEISNHQE